MTNVIPFGREVNLNQNEITQAITVPNAFQGNQKLQKILDQLNAEVEKKKDFMIHPQDLRMNKSGLLVSRDRTTVNHNITDWALGQVASKLNANLPIRYLRNCPPELQAVNVNHWLQQFDYEKHGEWMLRTHTGNLGNGMIRGVLSEKYSPFDDHEIMDILNQLFGKAVNADDIDIKMWYRDDKGFHLRLIFNDLTTSVGTLEDGTPDIHKVGLHIENSEVGAKSLRITPLIWRLVCSNGLMGWGVNKDMEIFTQRHIYLKPHEMYARVAEAIGNALKVGDTVIEKLVQAKETPVVNPLEIIAKLSEKNKYSKEFTEKTQGKFLEEEGNTAFHVIQAFTRACQEVSSKDRQVEIEADASKMLDYLIKVS
jgi:hypothetical protein